MIYCDLQFRGATSFNSGHTATVLCTYAQIGSLRSPTSYVRKTLVETLHATLGIFKRCHI